ncbi:hypothetical protein [Nonomuraea endophytica]|uniref:Uncharacterized protein n=1 Tax=Nonomuraea endophytica TaxID=714136 RepID=A0A7W8A5H7_9ACTN|nr:hypothetical protein [Nonomuraea endophytica]MBB5079904.1 hypothetical protein [Nonomuraea endophytica]
MNAELEYALMKNHAEELRRVAAEHRRAVEASKGRKGRRSVFARLLSH